MDIFDLTGCKMASFKGNKISIESDVREKVSNLHSDIYIIRTQNCNGDVWNHKLIKQ